MSFAQSFFGKIAVSAGVRGVKKSAGRDMQKWLALIQRMRSAGMLPDDIRRQIDSHEIIPLPGRFARPSSKGYVVNFYANEIFSSLTEPLETLSAQMSVENCATIVPAAVKLIVQKKSIFQCRDSHTSGLYYEHAEPEMAWQWKQLIEPYIGDVDFSSVLELAPGHGRNSAKLAERATSLHLVDVNQTCIDACKARFGTKQGRCNFFYHVTNGDSLPFIEDESITFVYSYDSMVHFDKSIIFQYLKEFARIMKPGATGFLHHSNYGAIAPNSDWAKNHGNRSDMSGDLFRSYCEQLGLIVTRQIFHGLAEGRGMDNLDCVSLIRK